MNAAGIIFWIVACIGVTCIARNRKPGPVVVFIVCLFFSPVIGLIVALLAKKQPAESTEPVAENQETASIEKE